ncbi:siderophore-interacting protein [Amnibacterium flavum]|uniref:Siderophore-interacting protein n=1 Tax=Amnibacterium flavum TaxID=2173173 RepID=A0A2V1HV14_9MICO|nr:siderophore-interacting protein [Amnibacterium flavum]PVZ93934.1 siderophore-interacting protein [Amnibacterium flavum]
MLTSQRTRPSYRPYRVRVARIQRLSSTFLRVTFSGPDLDVFGTDGLDQRIKLVLPIPGIGFSDFGVDDEEVLAEGSWYLRWRQLPDHARNPIRTYTVRSIRPDDNEIDVDFVCHGDSGPASSWVTRARVGDPLVIVGPDARSENAKEGIEFKPGAARRILLAGDETALPAISAILGSLPAGTRAHAVIEVPHVDDWTPLADSPDVTVSWLVRDRSAGRSQLAETVRAWYARECEASSDSPDELDDVDIDQTILWETPAEAPIDSLYAWIAGEASMVKEIRRYLVRDCGIHRRQVAFMGYWREGRSEDS